MNLFLKRIIFSVLIIINCMVIFSFSSQNSDTSSNTSGIFVDKLVKIINNITKTSETQELKDNVTFVVRKGAHLSIYTLLGIWLYGLANTFNISKLRKMALGFIFGFIYAMSDEIHQLFVGGRSCEMRDVCIDSCGILLGILICFFIIKIKGTIIDKKLKK